MTNEAGGLRLQRIPPTEKRGRVHTSTVTVVVIDPKMVVDEKYTQTDDKYFEVEWFSGTGKGGQKRNKSQSCCRVKHTPTGFVEVRQGRSRVNNYNEAKQAVIDRMDNVSYTENHADQAFIKKMQAGSGMRGDKVRTIRFQDDVVVDHRNGKRMSAKRFMRGFMEDLW